MLTLIRSRLTLRHLFDLLCAAALLLGVTLVAIASGSIAPNDPDSPPFASSFNEGDLIRQRDEFVGQLRGLPYADPGARTRAIDQLTRAEIARDRLRSPSTPAQLAVWAPLGPAPIPNGQTSGPSLPVSGRVAAIAVDPSDANIVYVGAAQGGVYRTLDGGATWTPLMDNAKSLAIGAITVDPLNHTIVFVGTGEGNISLDSFFGVGLYRINNANTTPVVNGPFEVRIAGTGTTVGNGHAFVGTAINRIAVDPANDNRIFVGNTNGASGMSGDSICCGSTTPPSGFIGLYFSANALAPTPEFSRVNGLPGGGTSGVTDVVFEPGSSSKLTVGVYDRNGGGTSGVYHSTDATNAPASSPTFSEPVVLGVVSSKLAINKVGSTVTVLAATGTSNGTLLRSVDGGVTFPTTISTVNGFCDGQCWYDIAVAMDPANASNILIGGSAGAFILRRTTDGGATFPSSQAGLHADVHAIAIAPSNTSVVYHGNDGGIFRSADFGTSWTSKNTTGFSATQFESVAVHPLDRFFTIGGTQDNGTNCFGPCNQAGNSWIRADYGDGGFALIDQNAPDTSSVTMYHTYFNQTNAMGYARVTSSANAFDANWSFYGCGFGGSIPNGMTCSATAIQFYAPMALGPGNPNTVYFGSDVLYRSSNAGVTMNKVSQDPILSGYAISAIGISPQNDNVRVVGVWDRFAHASKVYATTTGSTTLSDVTGAIPSQFVSRVVIDPSNANTAYVSLDGYGLSTGQHVWKTTNLNAVTPTWAAAGGSTNAIPDVPVNALIIDPQHTNDIFAGTDIGVYSSSDSGANWIPYGSGLPRVAVFGMAIQNPHRLLRIATHGKGMWETPLGLAERISLPLILK